MNNQQIAIDELKSMGKQKLIALQNQQRMISLIFKDTTGEAEKRDKLITIALEQLNNE